METYPIGSEVYIEGIPSIKYIIRNIRDPNSNEDKDYEIVNKDITMIVDGSQLRLVLDKFYPGEIVTFYNSLIDSMDNDLNSGNIHALSTYNYTIINSFGRYILPNNKITSKYKIRGDDGYEFYAFSHTLRRTNDTRYLGNLTIGKPVVKTNIKPNINKKKTNNLKILLENKTILYKPYFLYEKDKYLLIYNINNNIVKFKNFIFKNNKYKSIFEIIKNNNVSLSIDKFKVSNIDTIELLKDIYKVKLKSNIESGKLFGYNNIKNKLIGCELDNIVKYIENYKCKDNIERNIYKAYIKDIDRTITFCESDIELIIPDINDFLSGYTFPKNRKISVGKKVKVINNKNTNVKKDDILIIESYNPDNLYINRPYKEKSRGFISVNLEGNRRIIPQQNEPSRTTRSNIAKTDGVKILNKNCNIICVNSDNKRFNLKVKNIKVI